MSALYVCAGVFALGLLAFFLAPKGWRTHIMNSVQGAVLALSTIAAELAGFKWDELLGKRGALWVALTILLLNAIARYFTTTAQGRSA